MRPFPPFSVLPGVFRSGSEVNDDAGQRLGLLKDVDLTGRALVLAGSARDGEHEPPGVGAALAKSWIVTR